MCVLPLVKRETAQAIKLANAMIKKEIQDKNVIFYDAYYCTMKVT